MRYPVSGAPHQTAGYPPQYCRGCQKKLLYGMWLGVLKCSRCPQDNVRTLDDLLKWAHTQGVMLSMPQSQEELSG